MPRKNVLSELDKQLLLNIPSDFSELSKYYLLSEIDIALINQKRSTHNKLGFALLLCCIRYPGIAFNEDTIIPIETLEFLSSQLKIKEFSQWKKYFSRETTRLEHIAELKKLFGFKSFTVELYHYYLQRHRQVK
jgi:TnpA family transposase